MHGQKNIKLSRVKFAFRYPTSHLLNQIIPRLLLLSTGGCSDLYTSMLMFLVYVGPYVVRVSALNLLHFSRT